MLKSISIGNFRIFKGENRIILGTGETPISAVFGQGASGKTTIADAIFWCLDSKSIIDRYSDDHVTGILNLEVSDSMNEGDEASCSVELVFEIDHAIYQIKRIASFIKQDDVIVQTNNVCNVNVSNNVDAITINEFIERYYPIKLAYIMFFNDDRREGINHYYKKVKDAFHQMLLPAKHIHNKDHKTAEERERIIDDISSNCIMKAKEYFDTLKYREYVSIDYNEKYGLHLSETKHGKKELYEASATNNILAEVCLRLAIISFINKKYPEIVSLWDCIWRGTSEEQLSIKRILDYLEGQAIFLGHCMDVERITHKKIGARYMIERDSDFESLIIKEMN